MAVPSQRLIKLVAEAVGDASCVVALGGGADSAVLLASTVAAIGANRTRAVFVAHGLETSPLLEIAATAIVARCGVPLDVRRAPVEEGPNLEARARDARYAALAVAVHQGELLLTGHTQDDQAETVIMRLAQGAGATGLAGIPATREGIVRPFLAVSRADLRDEADAIRLPYVDDPANADDRFTRSRTRASVMPILESSYGDETKSNLARSSDLLRVDDAYLDELAAGITVRVDGARAFVPAAAIATLPPPVAARVVRRAMKSIASPGFRGTSRDVSSVVAAATEGGTIQLGSGWLATNEGAEVAIGPLPEVQHPLAVNVGEVVEWGGHRYTITSEPHPGIQPGGRFTIIDGGIGRELTFRGLEDGDRLDIGTGHTPVVELLRAHGVAASQRPVSLVIADGAKIAAVAGVRTAAWARPEPGGPVIIIEREVTT